jgi:membrane-associated phospholipid phosphatase
VSGHSTFSRAAAEVLAAYTGGPYFPGGLYEQTFPVGSLGFERGPSGPVTLQWATYYDAADQAGISRLYGGIHVAVDDFAGRKLGSGIGKKAFALAERYFAGTARP